MDSRPSVFTHIVPPAGYSSPAPTGEISPCPTGNSNPTRSIRSPPNLPRDPTIPSACLCLVQKQVSWGPPLLALLFPQVNSTHPRQLTENKLSTCLLPHWRERMTLAKASRRFLHNIRWVSGDTGPWVICGHRARPLDLPHSPAAQGCCCPMACRSVCALIVSLSNELSEDFSLGNPRK